MPSTLLLAWCIPALFLASSLLATARNYFAARKLGLPILIAPITWQNLLWAPLAPFLIPLIKRLLPSSLSSWTDRSTFGWTFMDRGSTHATLGPAFVVVSPHKNEIITSDPAACTEILTRYRDFVKTDELYAVFDCFGKNVDTVNGDAWRRHRKITAPAFKEANSRLVWDEAQRQTTAFAAEMVADDGDGSPVRGKSLTAIHEGCDTLALHVMLAAGFGKAYEYGRLHALEDGFRMSYGESLGFLVQNVMATVLFGALDVPDWILPAFLRKLKLAKKEFRRHMAVKIEEERTEFVAGRPAKDNLIATLVRANEMEKEHAKESEGEKKMVLSDDELYGNTFIFNVAGYETTSGQLTYVIPLLAAFPDVQDWVREEVDAVMKEGISYTDAFPKLVRTVSLMHETLRLYSATVQLPRLTASHPETIAIPSLHRSLTVPTNTYITANITATHLDPEHWGADARTWRPQRWVSSPTTRSDTTDADSTATAHHHAKEALVAAGVGAETLLLPPRPGAAFLGWSAGPRVCPGKRFSQVEFVAAVATLLRSFRLEPGAAMYAGLEAGLGVKEKEERARQKLFEAVDDSVWNITAKFRDGGSGSVRFVRR